MSCEDTTHRLRQEWDSRARATTDDTKRIDSSRRAQRMRFEIARRMMRLGGSSILDVGCGVGDLFGWLAEARIECDYTGVDLSPEMVARARDKYAGGRFEVADILSWPDEPRFDHTVAIGVHNLKVEGGWELLKRFTRRQFSLARVAAHLSLLTDRFGGFASHIQPWCCEDVLTFALTITPWVSLRHDYLPNDFSLTLYRRPFIETEPDLLLG